MKINSMSVMSGYSWCNKRYTKTAFRKRNAKNVINEFEFINMNMDENIFLYSKITDSPLHDASVPISQIHSLLLY